MERRGRWYPPEPRPSCSGAYLFPLGVGRPHERSQVHWSGVYAGQRSPSPFRILPAGWSSPPSEAGRKYIGSAVHRGAVVLHVVAALAVRLLDMFPLRSYRRQRCWVDFVVRVEGSLF